MEQQSKKSNLNKVRKTEKFRNKKVIVINEVNLYLVSKGFKAIKFLSAEKSFVFTETEELEKLSNFIKKDGFLSYFFKKFDITLKEMPI